MLLSRGLGTSEGGAEPPGEPRGPRPPGVPGSPQAARQMRNRHTGGGRLASLTHMPQVGCVPPPEPLAP